MIRIIGIGPSPKDITLRALEAIEESDVIIGYYKYINSINHLIEGKEVIKKGMGDEIARVELAIQKHFDGHDVAIISSGDPGVFGMANVFFQILGKYDDIEYEIVPGVTAANYGAALLGAPLHDLAIISLSDILTPLSEIKDKIEAAAKANLIIALYNPIGKKRKEPFRTAFKILNEILNPKTPVGYVKSSTEPATVKVTTLDDIKEEEIDMSTILIIGNSTTFIQDNHMISPRGYMIKHELHDLSREFYENYIEGKIQIGPNFDCEFYPCHKEAENCTFCYCPFYPCGDSSTGGQWIKGKNIWSCQNCDWIHKKDTVEYLKPRLSEILTEPDDLINKKKMLLKLRRECLHKTNK